MSSETLRRIEEIKADNFRGGHYVALWPDEWLPLCQALEIAVKALEGALAVGQIVGNSKQQVVAALTQIEEVLK